MQKKLLVFWYRVCDSVTIEMFRIMKTDADCFDTDMNAALRTGIEFVFGAFGNVIVFFILV